MYSRVYVEITNICNMHCSFCHGHSRKPGRMDEGQFQRILEQLTDQTKYIYYHLMGEPLTHPQLPRFLEMAADRGFRSVITTNGSLLDRRGEELLAAGVYKVSISLHSFEREDDRMLLAYLQKVTDFADAASRTGTISVFRLWNRGFDCGKNETILTFLRNRLAGPWAENTRGYRIRDRLFLEWGDRFCWPDKDEPVQETQVLCYGMQDHFGILCDGSVVPCCMDSEGVITLGNIFQEDISGILGSARSLAMAEGLARREAVEDLCRRCAYARRFL